MPSELKLLSHVRLFAVPWTVAYQAPPSMEFSRPECWTRLPFPSPGDLPDPGIKPRSPTLQADALLSELLLLLLLLLLSHFSRCRPCATPQAAAHQAPVPGILQARTLQWADISFPMHESEK